MSWIEFVFKLNDKDSYKDILIAKLAFLEFDSFDETTDSLKAYIDERKVTHYFLEKVRKASGTNFTYSCLENKNWNVIWESNFSPIMIDDTCFIRAPFHKKRKVKYDILINPKMSFGTGHHETTKMMISELLNLKEKPKQVLDVGCGTAILSIISEKLWNCKITAIDIDEWAIKNSLENIRLNDCFNIDIKKGNIQTQKKPFKYDLILANINTNVLTQDFDSYFEFLSINGTLIISGFLNKDCKKIKKASKGFSLISQKEENKWQCIVLKKIA